MDRYVKRGSTSVILHIQTVFNNNTPGGGGSNPQSMGVLDVVALGDTTGVSYRGPEGNIEGITTKGVYEAPTADKCRVAAVGMTGAGASDGCVFEVHLADSWFAKPGAQLSIAYIDTAGNPDITRYYVGLIDVDSPNGQIIGAARKNTALTGFMFLMTDSTNHAPATGKTVTVTRSINGGAFAAGTLSAVSEVGNGVYKVDFGAGDLNGTVVLLKATAPGCDTTFERVVTTP